MRKSGVSTGCRYCPNDQQCELQSVAERLGVTDLLYPVVYRGYEPEHDDPFFDRDYNICILCGRCVRMCHEVRGTSVLAFKYRGPHTQVGPAFGRTHAEAGCEFCGACVSVCPTGTLADKVSKWDGKPDGFEVSTCPFCALGCQLELQHKRGRLSRVHPHLDPRINDGQLCVRGRFCLPETTHHHDRATKPVLKRGPYFRDMSWREALEDVASHLRGLRPRDFLMVVSPDLTNESLYTAQKFVRSCLGLGGLDSTARWALPGGPGLWAELFSLPISIRGIGDADSILAVGLDSRFSFSVAGVEVRRALREGAALVVVDARESNLARYAQHWLRPAPGAEGRVVGALVEALGAAGGNGSARAAPRTAGVQADALARAASALAAGRDLAVLVGPTAFATDAGLELARALLRLAASREHTTCLPLFQGANTRGALELGAFREYPVGAAPEIEPGPSLADVVAGRARPKVLYLVGEVPFPERPDCEYVICQDLYRPPFEVDAFLPAASFAECGGTLTNVEGRVQQVVPVEELPDSAAAGSPRPDWLIFTALAEMLGASGAWPRDAAAILREINAAMPGFPPTADREPRRFRPVPRVRWEESGRTVPAGRGARLVLEPGGFRHRGTDLSHPVEGLSELGLERGVRMHPEDLRQLGLEPGEEVSLRVDGVVASGSARADADCPRHVAYVHRPFTYGGLAQGDGLAAVHGLQGSLHHVVLSRKRKPAAGGRAGRKSRVTAPGT
ncbi:MAG TPA: molybdopterin-dependent oxidoreductase [Candidatus Saccharimonadales bacterium]|nr:molybdopterin-dependent oxidoreductase [Candidatus Saccharimonadales bacterium]